MTNKRKTIFQQKTNLAMLAFVSGFTLNGVGFITALFSHSLIAITDTINGMVESLSMLFAWMALKGVEKANKEEYNYGRGKLENFASIGIALALTISFVLIMKHAIERIRHPEEVNLTAAALYVVISILSAGINFILWKKAHRIHHEAPSPSIHSQEHVFLEKVITSIVIIMSLGISIFLEEQGHEWGAYIDPIISMGLAFFILFSAYKIIKKSMYELLDGTLEESLQILIMRELTRNFNEYKELHGIRSHRVGDIIYIEIFMDFEDELLMKDVHTKIVKIKNDIETKIKGSQVMIIPVTEPPKARVN